MSRHSLRCGLGFLRGLPSPVEEGPDMSLRTLPRRLQRRRPPTMGDPPSDSLTRLPVMASDSGPESVAGPTTCSRRHRSRLDRSGSSAHPGSRQQRLVGPDRSLRTVRRNRCGGPRGRDCTERSRRDRDRLLDRSSPAARDVGPGVVAEIKHLHGNSRISRTVPVRSGTERSAARTRRATRRQPRKSCETRRTGVRACRVCSRRAACRRTAPRRRNWPPRTTESSTSR